MTQQNVVALRAGGQIQGIVPQTIEEVFRLAQGIAASGLAPKGMSTPEQITVAIMTGLEVGLPPMFAISKIAVINGRPTIWGDAIPALLLSRGFKLSESFSGEGEGLTATCQVKRPTGETITSSFSVTQARKAGLWGKQGPWSQYPDRMLQMRARGFACRDGAADVLGGLYLREEIEDPMRDVTPRPETVALPDIPDIPDIPDAPVEQLDIEDAPIADVDGFLKKLSDDVGFCQDAIELAEVAEANAEIISRLTPADQQRAQTILANDAA